ncbi:uncharacterized protein LOC115627248 isoform X2 [Scaptodrosophila lebanonensis]|uniref:Uncharacterized protein LOC115627248 isoform X2 n=1 Tax=Drosophila lebanonensis TaxID=7225 RepID=A0A6J2TRQ9_DROLE|nr:uncharacterized protein LOC115627248 isoform X2 [Scaptodrosophila lebanonensis]
MFHLDTVNAVNRETEVNPSNNVNIFSQRQQSQYHEQKLVEQFCRATHLIKIIEGAAEAFVRNYNKSRRSEDALAPIILRLDFTYTDLVTHARDLLELAIEEPLQFAEAIKYCAYGLVRAHIKAVANEPPALKTPTIDIAQLHAQWRILGLPVQRNLQFDPSQHLYRLGLALVHGILSAFSATETLVLQSIWYCGSGCMRNAIQTTSTDAPSCSNCSRPMTEYSKLRVTENYRFIAILPKACVQTPRVLNQTFRPILVRLRDFTYNCALKLGACYLITGYFSSSPACFESCTLDEA